MLHIPGYAGHVANWTRQTYCLPLTLSGRQPLECLLMWPSKIACLSDAFDALEDLAVRIVLVSADIGSRSYSLHSAF